MQNMVSTLEAGITKTTKRVTISNVNLDSHSRSCGNWNDDLKVRCFENPSRKFVERKGYEEGNVNEENKIGFREGQLHRTPKENVSQISKINVNNNGGESDYSHNRRRVRSLRPSLSSQLASIELAAQQITAGVEDMKNQAGSSVQSKNSNSKGNELDVLFSMPTKCLSIGFTSCKYPAPITFYNDRCEFVFYHPYESSEIKMIIWYRDMTACEYFNCKFSFKLEKKLGHFLFDYDPNNRNHVIAIELISRDALQKVKKYIRSCISSLKSLCAKGCDASK